MSEKGKPLVCVDFDGVLNDYEGWRGPNYMYSPRPGAKEFLQELQKEYTVAIFSTRPPYNIREWFELYNMPYDKIVTEKVPAVAYIDDRALRFDGNYHKVLYELKNFKTHWEKKYYDGYTNPDWDEDDGLRFHLAYESKTGWWAVNDMGVTLWKEEVIWELNELNNENEKLEKENKELKEELHEFKKFVFSDEGILCYSCVKCMSKGIYEVECSEKGTVNVHSTCCLYRKIRCLNE